MSTMKANVNSSVNSGIQDPRPRFLSEADCREIAQRSGRFSTGGGYTFVEITAYGRVTYAGLAIKSRPPVMCVITK